MKATTSTSESDSGVQPVESVRRALKVLGSFSSEDGRSLGVTDIANKLAMNKSTVHRMLVTLESEGFVRQVDGQRYAVGWKLFELSASASPLDGMRDIVLDELQTLVNQTGETAHLAVLQDEQVLYVEKVESTRSLRMPSSVGETVPLHCTALGKVLLAGLAESESNRLIYGREHEAITPRTITDPDELRTAVALARDTGYAIDDEEIDEGLMCVAGPITDDRATVRAAISIAGPASRIRQDQEEKVQAVLECGRRLSRRLGANARRLNAALT